MFLLERRAVIRNSIRRSHAATAMRDVCLNGNLVVSGDPIRWNDGTAERHGGMAE